MQDGIALAPERHALEGGWKKSAIPQGGAGARTTRTALEHDESGQIAGAGAEAVSRPRSECGAARRLETRVHEELRRAVIEDVRGHPAQPAHFIDDLAVMRKQIAQLHAALSVSPEGPRC